MSDDRSMFWSSYTLRENQSENINSTHAAMNAAMPYNVLVSDLSSAFVLAGRLYDVE